MTYILRAVAIGAAAIVVSACGSEGAPDSSNQNQPGGDLGAPGPQTNPGPGSNPDPGAGPGPGPGPGPSGDGTQCSADFCWMSPSPSGNSLTGVWSNSKTDTWWVGLYGTVLHDDGKTLRAFPSPTKRNLFAVGGTSANDVWIAGQTEVFHWDGKQWRSIDLAPVQRPNGVSMIFNELTVVAPGDVWLRDTGRLIHITTEPGAPNPLPTLVPTTQDVRVLASAPSANGERTPWIWTADKKYQRWNKQTSAFEVAPGGDVPGVTGQTPRHLWFTSANDAYASASSSLIHWDGSTWSLVKAPGETFASFGEVAALATTGPNDVWTLSSAGLFHFDGTAWTKSASNDAAVETITRLDKTAMAPAAVSVLNFQANAPNDIWIGGVGGRTFHFDGTKWTRTAGVEVESLNVVLALSPNDIWVGSNATASHFDGTKWEALRFSSLEPRPTSIVSATSISPKTAWIAEAYGDIKTYDGSKWTKVASITGDFVYASASDDVWVASKESNVAKHWNGAGWEDRTLPTKPVAFWGSAKDNIWVAGLDGTPGLMSPTSAWRYDGVSWSTEPAKSEHAIHAFAGSGPDEVYALTFNSNGSVRKLNPATKRFLPLSSGAQSDQAIWSRAKNDLWAVSSAGNVSRYDGTSWKPLESVTNVGLLGIGGTATDGPILVGNYGAVLKKR